MKSDTPVAGQIVIRLNLIRGGSLFALHGMHPVRPWRARSRKRCFPEFQSKVQTASGLLVLRPTCASTHGFLRPGLETAVTGQRYLDQLRSSTRMARN